MALPIFPIQWLTPETIKGDIVAQVISGGTALSGEEDVVQTDGGGRWEFTFAGINLNTVRRERLWNAWTSYLAGGARQVLVPAYSLRTAPRPVAGNGLARPSALKANDDVFPTEVGFATPYISAHALGAFGLGATTISVFVSQGSRVESGMRLGRGNRSYKVERVVSRTGLSATFVISPPLREPIASGAAINFEWPVVQCRAVAGQDLAAEMQFGRFGGVTVAFVEDFNDAA